MLSSEKSFYPASLDPPPPSSAPRRDMHTRGPPLSEYAGGRGDNVSAQTSWSVRMYKYSKSFHRVNQITSLATCTHQREPRRREYLIKGTFSLNRGPEYPPFLRIGTVPRLRKVQYSRLGVRRGPDYPLPTETETVSATRKAHTTAQNSSSRGPDYPTLTRIDTVSIPQKTQIRRAILPFSTQKSPLQHRRHS